jgi:hypothetical protein
MADRYWVGGTGNWNNSNTSNWSSTSGGASGASVPTASDNVFFNANSNTGTNNFTVTLVNTPRVCNNFTASGLDGTMTLAGSGIGLTVSGNLTFQATNFTRTYTGTTTFNATTTGKTVTTNGVSFGGDVTFDGVGGGWTLGSALNTGGNPLTVTNGTFSTSTSNYAVTANIFSSNNSNVRTITLNNSLVTLSSNATPWNMTTSTNATLNAGTSTISLTNTSPAFAGGGLTYAYVEFTSTALTTPSITGTNTIADLTITGRTTIGIGKLSLGADQTLTSFTVSGGTASAYRIMILSSVFGTTRTLTVGGFTVTDADFQDIAFSIAGGISTTRIGDCGGNSGLTFTTARTHYFAQTGSADWGATGTGSWASTSGGAAASGRFPLAQDTAVFPATTYPASSSTVSINANYNIGTFDSSLRVDTFFLDTLTSTPTIYGNIIFGTQMNSLNGTGTITLSGRTTQQITMTGKTWTQSIIINSPSGTVQLLDAYAHNPSTSLTLTNGTLDLNGQTCTTGTAFTTATGTKNLTFNGGTLVCPTAAVTSFNNAVPTGFTTTAGTGTGVISMTAATAKTFVGGGSTFNCTLNQGGAGALTITGSNTFSNITNTYKSTGATSILFTASTTSTFTDWNASGESTRLLTIGSVTAASHTLSKASGTVSADFLSISRSTATGGASWYAGANSTNGGNNSGWIFTAPTATATGNFLVFF